MRNCTAVSSILPMQDESSEQLPCFHGNSISAHLSVWYQDATKLGLLSKAKESSLKLYLSSGLFKQHKTIYKEISNCNGGK